MAFRSLFRVAQLQVLRKYSHKNGSSKPNEGKEKKDLPDSFTRCGDNGTSKTITGIVLSKDHKIFHAIGATEELLSYLGLAREYAFDYEHDYGDKIKRIQTIIIDISTAISKTAGNFGPKELPSHYTKELEEWIHEYSKEVPPLEQYIIPGGGTPSASLLYARSICRRLEREIISFVREGTLDSGVLIYLNRLSDLLLTMSRVTAKKDRRTENIYILQSDQPVQEQ